MLLHALIAAGLIAAAFCGWQGFLCLRYPHSRWSLLRPNDCGQ